MKIKTGGIYLIRASKNLGRRITIIVTKIDRYGYAYFKKYPHKESDNVYCDTVETIESIVSMYTPIKFIYKRRTSTFKPR